MAKLQDERMQLIGAAILAQARQEARALIDKANAMREAEIAECENEVINVMFDRVQEQSARIRLESMKAKARSELTAHRELLGYRSEKTESVFQNVRERLSKYVGTPEYRADMLGRARSLACKYDHSHSVVLVRADDIGLGREIQSLLGASGLQADGGIRLGGFKLRNSAARALVDETLDERLEEQKRWFLKNCGMKIM